MGTCGLLRSVSPVLEETSLSGADDFLEGRGIGEGVWDPGIGYEGFGR